MGEQVAIAIVGSGPAGLSAAARAAQRGVPHVLLEKSRVLSETIYKYQRGKHIMATPEPLVLRSDMPFAAGSRESILDAWSREVGRQGVQVRHGAEVKSITGQRGAFTLTLADKSTITAEAVILAIGTQGNPNLLRIPGADTGPVQYQLDDPREYVGEDIIVLGGGDAGIENALGLAADPGQENRVVVIQRGDGFPRAKPANAQALMTARDQGRLEVMLNAEPLRLEPGGMMVETPEGEVRVPCDRVIARIGSAPPRAFVEGCGVAFTSKDREAFPILSPQFESSVPGLYIVGALAGYPLIKHCMNQGHDVVEYILGNTSLRPADEPLLEAKFKNAPFRRSVDSWIETLRANVEILNDLSPLQMREFLLESTIHFKKPGDIVFERNDFGSSLFGIASGSVDVVLSKTFSVNIPEGQMFGEIGLISGRRRTATIKAAEPAILIEIPRTAAQKLMATVPGVRRRIERVATERMLKQIFGQELSQDHVEEILAGAENMTLRPGEVLIKEGDVGFDFYIVRTGSMTVSRQLGEKSIFLAYVPAGRYVGEMALFENGRRTATVTAAIKSEVVRLDGEIMRRILAREGWLRKVVEEQVIARRRTNDFVEARRSSFGSATDMFTSIASFLVEEGIGEATDALLIDENLCIGCDNCERACADAHEDGLSRLDREAGRTYAGIHVPTSCRHCEHPHCMSDCPPNAIHRAADGEVFIDDSCIGCGNCKRNCPYGVIQMEQRPPKKPWLLSWFLYGAGPGPGQADEGWIDRMTRGREPPPKVAVKCDMCKGIDGGPACVRACPTGAAIRVSPEEYLSISRLSDLEA